MHDFSVVIPRYYKDVYLNSFLPRAARLWNFLPAESFPLTYNLNGLKSRINGHLLFLDSLWTTVKYAFNFFPSFSCNSMHRIGWSALLGVKTNKRKNTWATINPQIFFLLFWLNWFRFLIFVGGPLFILIDYLSLCADVY